MTMRTAVCSSGARSKTISATNAYEVNIFDKRPDPSYRTGAIVNVAKPLAMVARAANGTRWSSRPRGPG
jgi:hypothetical protein